jgi:hypothetical protein
MIMVKQYGKSNSGEAELRAAAAQEEAPREKKVWDLYLNTDTKEGEDKTNSKLVAAFQVKAGRSKKDQKPYLFLSGFSKEIGGVNVALTHKVDYIIDKMIEAGFDGQMCAALERAGILK